MTRQALLSAPQRCLLGAHVPPHQAQLSARLLGAAHGPGLPLALLTSACPRHELPASHRLWKKPLLWRPRLSDSTPGVCHTPHARGLQAVHVFQPEKSSTTAWNQYTILALQRRRLGQSRMKSRGQGHTAPK